MTEHRDIIDIRLPDRLTEKPTPSFCTIDPGRGRSGPGRTRGRWVECLIVALVLLLAWLLR
jgi:hypothetical protein